MTVPVAPAIEETGTTVEALDTPGMKALLELSVSTILSTPFVGELANHSSSIN